MKTHKVSVLGIRSPGQRFRFPSGSRYVVRDDGSVKNVDRHRMSLRAQRAEIRKENMRNAILKRQRAI